MFANKMLQIFSVFMILIILACAGPVAEKKSIGDKDLYQRVEACWKAEVAANFEASYEFYTPEVKQKKPLSEYLMERETSPGRTTSYKIDSIVLEPNKTKAMVKVTFDFMAPPFIPSASDFVEDPWYKIDGIWYRDMVKREPPPLPFKTYDEVMNESQRLMRQYLDKGLADLRSNDVSQAVQNFNRAISSEPVNIWMEMPFENETFIKEVLPKLNLSLKKTKFHLSKALSAKNLTDLAAKYCQEAALEEPNDAQIQILMGDLNNKFGKKSESWSSYQKAIELIPDQFKHISFDSIGRTMVTTPVDILIFSGTGIKGDFAKIIVNGEDVSPNSNGFNMVLIDPVTGNVTMKNSFDTSSSEQAVEELMTSIDGIPKDIIVALATRGDAWIKVNDDLIKKLISIGAKKDLRGKGLWGYATIGVVGKDPRKSIEIAEQDLVCIAAYTPATSEKIKSEEPGL